MKLWMLLAFLAQAETSSDSILKPGQGRGIVTAACTQCHTAEIIVASHMSRKTWDTTLTWMEETQGLVELEPDTRKRILDYLVLTQGLDDEADTGSSPWANPLYRPNPIW